jgi:polysaccharide biosynthesis PFTS motif protein
MMFYNGEEIASKPEGFTIQIFDVTPSRLPISQASFYSEPLMINFLENIISIQRDFYNNSLEPLTWKLKPKRRYHKTHSARYISQLSKMNVELLDSGDNLYEITGSSNFVICVPYTSPALIAKELGVPVCYFSTASDFELLDFIDEIPVHKSVESLKSHIELVLTDYSRTRNKNL